jgi:hypothetical protein
VTVTSDGTIRLQCVQLQGDSRSAAKWGSAADYESFSHLYALPRCQCVNALNLIHCDMAVTCMSRATLFVGLANGAHAADVMIAGLFPEFWGSMLHGHFRQTTMALPTRVEPGEPHKL